MDEQMLFQGSWGATCGKPGYKEMASELGKKKEEHWDLQAGAEEIGQWMENDVSAEWSGHNVGWRRS